MTDPRHPVSMPEDFRLQVAYWRNHARRFRAQMHDGTDPLSRWTTEELDQERIEGKNE